MMFWYFLNFVYEVKIVEDVVCVVIDVGLRIKDMGGSMGIVEVGDVIVVELVKIFKV